MKDEFFMLMLFFSLVAFAAFAVSAVDTNVDSVKNCSKACGAKMASYTEAWATNPETKVGQLVPVCTCASGEAK